MPQVHTYIRNEDMEKWKALPNKSAFIHEALNGKKWADTPYKDMPEVADYNNSRSKALEVPGVVSGSDFVPRPPDPITGYPCCTKNKPCKHWVWDSSQATWVNSLTGEIRDE